jgi:XTP/dITP diphosphohydrolase
MNDNALLVATFNQGKSREIRKYLSGHIKNIVNLQDLHINKVFPECGWTFLENARGKSLFYGNEWEGLTLAEDSGLEIDRLQGEPGVHSARYAGPDANDEKNIEKVLSKLKGIPYDQRKARFICCMVLSREGKVIKEIQESVGGFITTKKVGKNGFGYDPIFYYPPLRKTFAQMSETEKNQISHRGKALKKLRNFLT